MPCESLPQSAPCPNICSTSTPSLLGVFQTITAGCLLPTPRFISVLPVRWESAVCVCVCVVWVQCTQDRHQLCLSQEFLGVKGQKSADAWSRQVWEGGGTGPWENRALPPFQRAAPHPVPATSVRALVPGTHLVGFLPPSLSVGAWNQPWWGCWHQTMTFCFLSLQSQSLSLAPADCFYTWMWSPGCSWQVKPGFLCEISRYLKFRMRPSGVPLPRGDQWVCSSCVLSGLVPALLLIQLKRRCFFFF